MWLWRPNRAKARLVVRIMCVTLTAHLFLMGLLFLRYGQSSVRSFTVSTQKPLHGQRIIVLPFHRAHPASPKASSNKMPGLRHNMVGRSVGKPGDFANQRTPLEQKAAIIPKKTAIATHMPTKPKTITSAQAKTPSKKIDQVKSATKKAVAKTAKVVAKKKDAVKKISVKKIDTTQQKTPKIEKNPEPEIKKQIQEIEKKPVQPTPCQKEAEKTEQAFVHGEAEPSVMPADVDVLAAEDAVYMDRDEYDIFIMHEQMQAEVARCWRPPLGVAPHTSCTIAFYVNWQGQVETCTTLKPSSVLMFDMSARASLKDMVFPRFSYGKEIKLTFIEEKTL